MSGFYAADGCAGRPVEGGRFKSVTAKALRAPPAPSHARAVVRREALTGERVGEVLRNAFRPGTGKSPSVSPPVVAGTASGRPEAIAADECKREVGPARSSREGSEQAALAAADFVDRRGRTKESAEL